MRSADCTGRQRKLTDDTKKVIDLIAEADIILAAAICMSANSM